MFGRLSIEEQAYIRQQEREEQERQARNQEWLRQQNDPWFRVYQRIEKLEQEVQQLREQVARSRPQQIEGW